MLDIQHEDKVNCACNSCMDEDCAAIIAAHPRSTWTRQKLEWIRVVRMKPLNWTLPAGHCALCGGTSLSAWDQGQHGLVTAHNPQRVGDIIYTSILVANGSSWAATYRFISRFGKDRLRNWAADVLGVSQTFARAVAVRTVENWTEIRVGLQYGQ
jgi:hypothetical protein